ncbi:hypothetical protein GSI_09474 [Ganoderma sinense ZZ0214-1]|uniref:Uncharacterized protein n=1 Tax=Ganoderma sinense ZZ0214-1 TaxID=1077348 RepID=A0A2G8S6M0_9APHY|nr:hypothetical protein GSI_09474 [Ganoderma sinense ZZ0214-1]
MAPLLTQLRSDRTKYQELLAGVMSKKAMEDTGLQELQTITSVASLQDVTYVAEQASGKCCLLAHRPIDAQNIEEVVLRVQGFITDAKLPPVRQYNIPRNLNRLIDLKQSITLTGLGSEGFDSAVHGIQIIYQVLSNHVARAGGRLREWTPGRENQDLTLTFANRYLTSSRDAGEEPSVDLSTIVDPFNVVRPILRGEVHTADNVVEYWERRGEEPSLWKLTMIKDYNVSAIRCLASGQLSLLKKVKRKVGYQTSSSEESGNDDKAPPPNKQLRLLNLGPTERREEKTDVSMKDLA